MKVTHEFKEIAKAWLAISIAFGILIFTSESYSFSLGISVVIAAITVGLGFVVHELSHRHFARKFGKHAEFKANNTMLLVAIVMSFFGFIIAAPGAVVISGFVSKREGGIIASVGPAANIILALLFLPLVLVTPAASPFRDVFTIGLMINAVLATFNLIPFLGFDGKRIIDWNKAVYFIMIISAIVLTVVSWIMPNFPRA